MRLPCSCWFQRRTTMSKYQDELIAQLLKQEPEAEIDNGGEKFSLHRLEDMAGAILAEDEDGQVTATWFEDDEELSEAWDALSDDDQADDDEDDDED